MRRPNGNQTRGRIDEPLVDARAGFVGVRSMTSAGCAAMMVGALLVLGCGGGGDKEFAASGGSGGGDADAPVEFAKRFARLTGVRLMPAKGDLSGTRLEVAQKPDRFPRFGVYTLVWTKDDRRRKVLLGHGRPDARGIYWQQVGGSYSAVKPIGPRLVLSWIGRRNKETTPQWDRLERAVRASLAGKLDLVPPPERPCRDAGLDPLHGRTGECSRRGIPVTFVNVDQTLSVPALTARVLGVETAGDLRFPNMAPVVPRGRFFIVAYRVRNTGHQPIKFLQPKLKLGGRTVAENPEAGVLLPRSRSLPLPPGATMEARAAFDLPPSSDGRKGVFLLPAERDDRGDPSLDLAQGWIRLDGAPAARRRRGRGRRRPPPPQSPVPEPSGGDRGI